MLALAFALLTGLAVASPLAVQLDARNNDGSNFVSPSFLNLTYSSPYNASLPNVVIMATGGTIAGKGAGAAASGVYNAGAVGIEALVEAVPDLLNISNIYGYQIVNVDSGRINSTIQLELARAANAILCAEDSTVAGVVVTHGTDTLDETAFFLDATVNCEKPVVIVGSMRPSTAYSADGPANLLQAVTAAASPESKNRGALITMNDRVGQAYYTQKTHLNFVDTFKAPEPGYVGAFYNNKLYYFSTASQPTCKSVLVSTAMNADQTVKKTFDVSNLSALPRVDILYGQQEFDARLLESALSYGDVKGIIVPGPDGAGLNDDVIAQVASQIPVVLAWRVNNGLVGPEAVAPTGNNTTISAGLVNSHKSRILLQLALATGKDPRDTFETQLRNTLYG